MDSRRAAYWAAVLLASCLLLLAPAASEDAVAETGRTSITAAQDKSRDHGPRRDHRDGRERRDEDGGLLEGIKLADYLLGLGIAAAIGAFGGLIYATLTRPTDRSQE